MPLAPKNSINDSLYVAFCRLELPAVRHGYYDIMPCVVEKCISAVSISESLHVSGKWWSRRQFHITSKLGSHECDMSWASEARLPFVKDLQASGCCNRLDHTLKLIKETELTKKQIMVARFKGSSPDSPVIYSVDRKAAWLILAG